MFVAKSELVNTWKFFKLRLRDARIGIWIVLAVMAFVCVWTSVQILINTLGSTDPINIYTLSDFSWFLIAVMSLALVILMSRDKNSRKRYAVYPLTNMSRFLSTQLLCYFLIALGIVAAVFFYFVQYFLFVLVSVRKPDVTLAFSLGAKYLVIGSLVLFVWLALFVALLSVLDVCVRVFKLIAFIPLVVASAILLQNQSFLSVLSERLVLLVPRTLGIFFLRGFIIWLVLFGIAFVLNKPAGHLRVLGSASWSSWLIYVPLIVVTGAFVLSASGTALGGRFFPLGLSNYTTPGMKTITLDASRASGSSAIEIRQRVFQGDASNPSDLGVPGGICLHGDQGLFFEGESPGEGDVFTGQKVVVTYQLPTYLTNNPKLMEYARPELAAQLNGTVLNIDYRYAHKVNVIYPSTWVVLNEFTKYDYENIGKELGTKQMPFSNGFIEVSAK
ncbi:MAG: hypothetical protein FWD65_02205 [Coriobacteriia bacterium]|nr:hypothetical protein [Coriobacteriia bacterium]